MLFSGGIDSLAGAVETLVQTSRRIALVSHRSAPKILPHQTALAAELQRRFPGRVFPMRVYAARTKSGDANETTQRSRSFLYAALGFAAATLFGIDRIRFCENGVVSIHLPLSRQVIGTMATRTTHPLSVRLLRQFLSLVAEKPLNLANPFIWKTKTDVFESLKRNQAADLVRKTVSCSSVRAMRREERCCRERGGESGLA